MPLARYQAVWQTHAINMKLLKLNLISIINCTTSKNVLKFGLLILFNFLNLKNLSSHWLELAILTFLTFLTFAALAGNSTLAQMQAYHQYVDHD